MTASTATLRREGLLTRLLRRFGRRRKGSPERPPYVLLHVHEDPRLVVFDELGRFAMALRFQSACLRVDGLTLNFSGEAVHAFTATSARVAAAGAHAERAMTPPVGVVSGDTLDFAYVLKTVEVVEGTDVVESGPEDHH